MKQERLITPAASGHLFPNLVMVMDGLNVTVSVKTCWCGLTLRFPNITHSFDHAITLVIVNPYNSTILTATVADKKSSRLHCVPVSISCKKTNEMLLEQNASFRSVHDICRHLYKVI